MKITIDETIKKLTPQFEIGVFIADIQVFDNPAINPLIQELETTLSTTHTIEEVVTLDIIKDGRDAYKTYGKDPSRYRLATESLYRRIVKGNHLYRINNVVDLGNIISLQTRKSVAVLDYHKIKGDIIIRLGVEEDYYEGIGRGSLNITNIPLYEDEISPFGSTTSDTERTKITNDTSKILLFIISFSGKKTLLDELKYTEQLYIEYAEAKNTVFYII